MQVHPHIADAGHRAALHLKLAETTKSLAQQHTLQNDLLDRAANCRALAAEQESPHSRETYYAAEVQCRLQAAGHQPAIDRLLRSQADIQRELNELADTEAALGEVMA